MEPPPSNRRKSTPESKKPVADASQFQILEGEASFRAAFEASGIGMAICTTQGRWLRVNESLSAMLGYSRDELLGIAFAEITHPEDIERSLDNLERIAGGDITEFRTEKRYIHADGHSIWANLTVSSVMGPQGKPLFFVAQIEDVTENRRLERELKAVNERLALATRAGGVGVWDWDIANDRLSWDAQMCRLYGIAAEHFHGKIEELRDRIHQGDVDEYFRRLDKSQHNGESFNMPFRIVLPSGQIRHLRAFATVERNAKGRPVRMVGTNWDISTAVQQKEDLQKLAERARQASLAKSQFLANVSHEIRTPLNGVIGMTHLLLDMPGLNQQHRETAELILGSSESLMTLINQILDFAKVESGKLELDIHRFNLRALIRQLMSPLTLRAEKAGIALNIKIDKSAPQRLNGDSGKLKQVIHNLVDNAIKFTRQGSVTLNVAVQEQTENHVELTISVTDTGIGIPPAVQKRLFSAFTQADPSTTRLYGGTGLGLAISKEIVELMGGVIGVGSEAGQGSTFWFSAKFEIAAETASGFPAPQSSAHPAPERSTIAEAIRERLRSQSTQALLAEDNPVNQLVALGMLDRLGIAVDTVTNGLEAIESYRRKQYDLVFMDVQMPDVDGLEAALAIREWEAENQLASTPIIAMTAHARPEDRRACLAAGMNDCLTKPLSPDKLANVIDQCLKSNSPQEILPEGEPKLFDTDLLQQRLGGDQKLIREVLNMSLSELSKLLQDYRKRLQANDLEKSAHCLHTIYGVAASASFLRIAQAVSAMEKSQQYESTKSSNEAIAELDHLLKETQTVAISYLASSEITD
ncbi:PAS domain-containing protein [Cerasicoccus frondis]|uniref:PAS domain-containing protein n=1 Tax=Cerasicoccus frondis TaxID=490090 RepID=UPI00285287A6|nr:PAS domain-containing protein [Cerasicoccus frondis]